MQRLLFIVHISLISSSYLHAQELDEWKEYADAQYEKGNYALALKEYQRVLLFDEDHLYEEVYGQIASLYFELNDFDNALTYYDFAWKATQDDSLKVEFAFWKTLCYYKLDRFYLGLTELYDLPEQLSSYFERKKNLYFAICHYGLEEHDQSLEYLSRLVDSTGYERIESSFAELSKAQKKYNPDKLEIMSIFLPGLGQTVAGDVGSGINSLLLLGGITTYSYYTMLNYSILDGTLVLLTWFYRYYTGGHKKAYQLGVQRIQEQKNRTYLRILDVVRHHAVTSSPGI
jgi:tetratricopeptide (TPR) repeat protein